MSQGWLYLEITFLAQKLWSVARVQRHRHTDTQTDRHTRKWILRAPFQGFMSFSFNLSSRIGPINISNVLKMLIIMVKVKLSLNNELGVEIISHHQYQSERETGRKKGRSRLRLWFQQRKPFFTFDILWWFVFLCYVQKYKGGFQLRHHLLFFLRENTVFRLHS